MDPKFQSSFIPKKQLHTGKGEKLKKRSWTLASVLIIVIFVATLVGVVGAFVYMKVLEGDIATLEQELTDRNKSLNEVAIDELYREDQRIRVAKDIIREHLAPTAIFDLLSDITVTSVRFTDFEYETLPGESAQISMSAQAWGYSSVAVLSQVLDKHSLIEDSSVGGLVLNEDGTVGFKVEMTLSPEVTTFEETLPQEPS